MAEELGNAGRDRLAARAGRSACAGKGPLRRGLSGLRLPRGAWPGMLRALFCFCRKDSGMNGLKRLVACIAAAGCIAICGLAPAQAADAVTDFYKGRTVQVLVGFGPGGGYDLYARTLARYMGRHIPGNPTMVPQNMPGAGGVKAMNYLYNVARKDGTVIGTVARGLAIEPLLGHAQGMQFDATKF